MPHGGSTGSTATVSPSPTVTSIDDLTGQWSVVTSNGDSSDGSFMGYRVGEELSGIGVASQGLETSTFPTGSFTLDEPIEISGEAASTAKLQRLFERSGG